MLCTLHTIPVESRKRHELHRHISTAGQQAVLHTAVHHSSVEIRIYHTLGTMVQQYYKYNVQQQQHCCCSVCRKVSALHRTYSGPGIPDPERTIARHAGSIASLSKQSLTSAKKDELIALALSGRLISTCRKNSHGSSDGKRNTK